MFISAPVFFAAEPSQYSDFIKAFVTDSIPFWFLRNILSRAAWRTMMAVFCIFSESAEMRQVLDWTWYSTVPFKWGDNSAVKYHFSSLCHLSILLTPFSL
jgi:hypothetical protein